MSQASRLKLCRLNTDGLNQKSRSQQAFLKIMACAQATPLGDIKVSQKATQSLDSKITPPCGRFLPPLFFVAIFQVFLVLFGSSCGRHHTRHELFHALCEPVSPLFPSGAGLGCCCQYSFLCSPLLSVS